MPTTLPIPPVAANVNASGYGDSIPKAWKTAKAAAVSQYAKRDASTLGTIASSGSWIPSMAADTTTAKRLPQTFTEADTYL